MEFELETVHTVEIKEKFNKILDHFTKCIDEKEKRLTEMKTSMCSYKEKLLSNMN